MKRLRFFLSSILITVIVLTTFVSQRVSSASQKDTIRVMVAYEPGFKRAVESDLLRSGGEIHYSFDELNSLALTLPATALDGISHNPHVIYVEDDPLRYMVVESLPVPERKIIAEVGDPYLEQMIPYGIDMVQARAIWDSNHDGVVDPGAPTGAGITVCIIDSGLYTGHEDLKDVNVIGGYGTQKYPWDADGFGHGTHVAGTITAMNNAIGVVGVTPGTVSLYIVRVFGDSGTWIQSSSLIDAAYRCRDNNADIISMSLAGSGSSTTERLAFESLYNNGILSIAAASNDGTSAYAYPASYDSVISVAAIDSNELHADFSNYNNQVELAAPGVGVLSTVPYVDHNTVTVDGVIYSANHIEYSGRGSISGTLINGGICDTVGAWTGQVVLCERGTNSFYEKVINVQNGGGVAAMIYNNVPGNFLGTVGNGHTSAIIGLSLSQEDGQYLVANKTGFTASVASVVSTPGSGYEAWDGTSMATPHVSGVAALVWSCLPTATNTQVRNALTATAKDLGAGGRDVYYGYGLVQAKAACDFLSPTAVELLSFTALGGGKAVTLTWETTSEVDNLGFNLYRASSTDGKKTRVNAELIPSAGPGNPFGAVYSFTDAGLRPKKTYLYWLEDVDIYGKAELYGPVETRTLAK